jgi:2'-5' RNA ligase
MRLFVAIDIDASIRQRLDAYTRAMKPRVPGVRFVAAGNYHVTLKFLGEVAEARLPEVRSALEAIRYPLFSLDVRGVGFFPNEHAPRVFWAGIGNAGGESAELAGLARQVQMALQPLGFTPEREFRAHLTLARNGSGRPRPVRGEKPPAAFAQLSGLVTAEAPPEFGTMTAREFFLYESRLSPAGAVYTRLQGFGLHAGGAVTDADER